VVPPDQVAGPLSGLKVIEFDNLAPIPFAGMMLADLGADVLRIVRAGRDAGPPPDKGADILGRGRAAVAIDLKAAGATELVLHLVDHADVLIEGYRPQVMERLGLGPEPCLERNPGLVYGRLTGWGQTGPLAHAPGHDINYIAVAGALHLAGERDGRPMPPANLLGDFAGGSMFLVVGVLAALFERQMSGAGQVIDAAMVDGAALLTTLLHGLAHSGQWKDVRESNLVDGGAPFYGTYRTADDRYVAVGAIEEQFFAELATGLRSNLRVESQKDEATWRDSGSHLAATFRTRTRDEWCRLLEGTDACLSPVLGLSEVADHPQIKDRETFVVVDGIRQPGPAPRFSRTPAANPMPANRDAGHAQRILLDWGLDEEIVRSSTTSGVVPP
jgi:alpha-methylacyl-CoA racemase